MKPATIGTVWTATARIQRINGTKWQTIATCMDTPNAIKTAANSLISAGYRMVDLWVVGDVTGRMMIVDL